MQETEEYQLVNSINKEKRLAVVRSKILEMPAEKALDTILDASFPASLVQSFPEQDLHFLMHHIGKDDFIPVLGLASSQQWEYLLDIEVWSNDRLDIDQTTNILSLLYKADPERLLRWTIKEKTEFIEYYLFKNIEIQIREHDEDPSEFQEKCGNQFTTIDSIFYFRFPEAKKNIGASKQDEELSKSISGEEAELLITDMLNKLADMDISIFHGLMLETGTIIPAEIEEEEFRLKSVRLAEKGFLPPHEAIAVYQPLNIKHLKKRPELFLKKPFFESNLPYPPLYPKLMLQKKNILQTNFTKNRNNLFSSALEYISKDQNIAINLQSEFAFLVNSVVSADKKIIRSREELDNIVEKVCCYLSLGIESIYSENSLLSGLTVEVAASIICSYAIKDIFRIGSSAGIALKERARKWYFASYIAKVKLPLTFLGEKWLGVVGGLLLEIPLYFKSFTDIKNINNSTSKIGHLSSNSKDAIYRPFSSLEEIEEVCNELNAIILVDNMLRQLAVDFKDILSAPYFYNFITWKSIFMTLWAIKRMGLLHDSAEFSIPLSRFKPFFIQLLNLKSQKQVDGSDKTEHDKVHNDSKTYGKIGDIARNDFFNWLAESAIEDVKANNDNSNLATIRKIFNEVFDEIEDEYGSISSEDIDPKLIFHFIISSR